MKKMMHRKETTETTTFEMDDVEIMRLISEYVREQSGLNEGDVAVEFDLTSVSTCVLGASITVTVETSEDGKGSAS